MLVLALEVCEHILASKILGFYESVRSLLNPNGKFIVTVPVYEDLEAQTLRCPHCNHMHSKMGHVRSYTPELIKAELELAGFVVTSTAYIYSRFANTISEKSKRYLTDIGKRLLGMQKTIPLNVVIITEKK